MELQLPLKRSTLLLRNAGGASFEKTSHITRGRSLGEAHTVESWHDVSQFLLMQFEVVGFGGRGREIQCSREGRGVLHCVCSNHRCHQLQLSTLKYIKC